MANNNEKIQNLLEAYSEVTPLMNEYLQKLQDIYTYKNNARSDFFTLKRDLNNVVQTLRVIARKEKRKVERLDFLLKSAKREAAQIEDKYIENVDKRGSKELQELLALNISEFSEAYAEQCILYSRTKLRGLGISKMNSYLTTRVEMGAINFEKSNIAKQLAVKLSSAVNGNMSSLKKFSMETLKSDLEPITLALSDFGFVAEAENIKLSVQFSSLDYRIMPERPKSDDISEIFHSRRAQNMYIRRGYTVLNFSRPVYKSMSYLERALAENREYVGTKNAFDKYRAAINDLENYYYSSYVQVGGKPKNFHGHHPNEHE
ncbi:MULTISPECIES: hypothetical protein [Lactobacillus]|uniref:Uncharacterized protein n=1 Tax=Lactobacillus johnsonii TaxID=33959 RepID=A0A9X5AM89_LACJH|nr:MULTISPECIES: hypothetical protein [Lactobacillus]MTE03654.1 hypothetical protein [Lactobacillus johnsonii]